MDNEVTVSHGNERERLDAACRGRGLVAAKCFAYFHDVP